MSDATRTAPASDVDLGQRLLLALEPKSGPAAIHPISDDAGSQAARPLTSSSTSLRSGRSAMIATTINAAETTATRAAPAG